jgi:hypothetical protein
MHSRKILQKILPALALAMTSAVPGRAQVEKVAVFTSGISCGVCAAVSEVNFRRMPGVDKVSISLSKEAIILTYKPGVAFNPHAIRETLKPLDVQVVRFQISARGRVQEQAGKRFLIAGKDKFVLAPFASSSAISPSAAVLVEGIVNDRIDPMEMKLLGLWPIN